jgi:hypothetical protein
MNNIILVLAVVLASTCGPSKAAVVDIYARGTWDSCPSTGKLFNIHFWYDTDELSLRNPRWVDVNTENGWSVSINSDAFLESSILESLRITSSTPSIPISPDQVLSTTFEIQAYDFDQDGTGNLQIQSRTDLGQFYFYYGDNFVSYFSTNGRISPNPIPLPASLSLVLAGLVCLGWLARCRKV